MSLNSLYIFSIILRFLFKHPGTSRPRTIRETLINRVKSDH